MRMVTRRREPAGNLSRGYAPGAFGGLPEVGAGQPVLPLTAREGQNATAPRYAPGR